MPQPIATVPASIPVMVYLPLHGGWFRALVSKPVNTKRGPVRNISLSGALRTQVDMHTNLTTALATHWDTLPASPVGEDASSAFSRLCEYCNGLGITINPTEEGFDFYMSGREVLHITHQENDYEGALTSLITALS